MKRLQGCLAGMIAMGSTILAVACTSPQPPEQRPAATAVASPPAAPGPGTGKATGAVTRPGDLAATMATPAVPAPPRRIALLLPLSGAQRPLAEAVRDGFMAAYFDDQGSGSRPGIIIVDEENPGAAEAYRAAIAAGANVVVGPLLKESVVQVAAMAGTAATLTLNYLESGAVAPQHFHQFALSPEDEAVEAAARAVADGRSRALALAPDNEWGRRMVAAFEPALQERGGQLLDYRLYDPAATDFTADIQRLLELDESRARHRQLSANLGIALEFEPRRRSDVDFIFLVANVPTGRLIRPQLRFLYAADLPTYASSAIYQPGITGDPELDGVMFTDAPVVLGTDDRAQDLRRTITARWPAGTVARLRFFAMGFDAYHLASALPTGPVSPVSGLSGDLSMDTQGRVHRQMPWAEFRDGRIAVLPPAVPPDPATTYPQR